jgi:hypothetical protein
VCLRSGFCLSTEHMPDLILSGDTHGDRSPHPGELTTIRETDKKPDTQEAAYCVLWCCQLCRKINQGGDLDTEVSNFPSGG